MSAEKKTNFEKFWLLGMQHTEVLQHLHFHKSAAPPAGDQQDKLAKVRGQLQSMQEQMQGLKRKMGQGKGQRDWQGGPSKGKGKKGAKGGGGNKGAKGGKGMSGVPQNIEDCKRMRMQLGNGDKCCWHYHLPQGCTDAQPGQWCNKGWHLCPRCGKPHSLQVPCP